MDSILIERIIISRKGTFIKKRIVKVIIINANPIRRTVVRT
jgi:hypothetical protein